MPQPVHHKLLEWRMRASGEWRVYARCQTSAGEKYLWYDGAAGLAVDEAEIHHGLLEAPASVEWTSVRRNLEADLKDALPSETLISITGFFVRGSVARVHALASLSRLSTKRPIEPKKGNYPEFPDNCLIRYDPQADLHPK